MLTARDIELGVLLSERQERDFTGGQRAASSAAHTAPAGGPLLITVQANSSNHAAPPQVSRFATQDVQAARTDLSEYQGKEASSEDAVLAISASDFQPSLGTGLQIEAYIHPHVEEMKVEEAGDELVGMSGPSMAKIEAMVMSLKSLPPGRGHGGDPVA
jgi:hypothetical protein